MNGSSYHAFERKAKPFGSCDIPAPVAETEALRISRALRALSTQDIRSSTEELCDHCGTALLTSNCPAQCDEGEIHADDFTSEACPVCRGEAQLWWCPNVDCITERSRRHPMCHDNY